MQAEQKKQAGAWLSVASNTLLVVGKLIVGWVIDIDHWRHVYLLMGIVWGCIMLEQKWQHDARASQPTTRPVNDPASSHQAL